jgi:hypothetical protein
MNGQLSQLHAQQHIADLHHAAERARRTTSAGVERRSSRGSHPITRLTAQLARLTTRLAPPGGSEASHPAPTPRAPDPVFEICTATETSRADVP